MKNVLLFILFVMTGTAQAAQTITAQVNGMVCAFCAQGIEKKARALPQTEDVYVNLKQKIVAIQVKEGQTIPTDTIKTLIQDAGYDVKQIETTDDTTATIRSRLEQE
ncbi:MAG TPA: heavy metal-associated domain-containing protein [Dongiaceae bacterium]|nr:heavy metal-associated domain-containing protein [Dongiaceae bacterium]